ncbi:unnamed protein product [Cladocopium goreaui]|uniref:Uncharacterized protein n=1 Tax=Cladocopium goreaui TaxID=2562237 RepID=A0A9P1BRK8_9DINO|nr:unnamed protein product [Cladocopium goreaui]
MSRIPKRILKTILRSRQTPPICQEVVCDQGHEHEAKVQSMEVSPTGEAHLQPSAMNPVRAVPQSLAPEAAPNHPPSDPHLSSEKFGHLAEGQQDVEGYYIYLSIYTLCIM